MLKPDEIPSFSLASDRATENRRGVHSVHIGKLSAEVTKMDLLELFSAAGSVVRVWLSEQSCVNERRFGFVSYQTISECLQAIKVMNRTWLKGHQILVSRSLELERTLAAAAAATANTDNTDSVSDEPSEERRQRLLAGLKRINKNPMQVLNDLDAIPVSTEEAGVADTTGHRGSVCPSFT